MILPFDANRVMNDDDGCYRIVAWNGDLPAFDPLPMFKTVFLSPSSLKQLNRIMGRLTPHLGMLGVVGLSVRITTFASPASVGCILAPISVILQIPGLVWAIAHMRTEYMKVLVCTFDFWFLETANTLWAVTFCAVLGDYRVVLVLFCWVDFTFWLLEEAYLHNSHTIVGVALMQWTFYVLLTVLLSLGLIDGVQHYKLITTGGRTLSTNDVLTNLLVTMTMLSLRNVYRRYRQLQQQNGKRRASVKSLGYRCKIALSISGTQTPSTYASIAPQQMQRPGRTARDTKSDAKKPETNRLTKRPLLRMVLAAESARFNPRDTVWPRIGALTPLSTWQLIVVHACGSVGGAFAALTLFLPRNTAGARVSAVCALISSAIYCGVQTCCFQRQLLKRVVASFYFLFLELQIIAAAVCVADMFEWRWIPTCGVSSTLLLGFPILASDSLTPAMKHRLRHKHWIIINGIVSYVSIQVVVLLDALMWGNMGLHDRVIFDFTLVGRQTKFCIVPFFLSRIVTITVWSARNTFVALTRPDDNALILLRGEVEFDYEGWKTQSNLGPRLRR